MSDDDRPDHLQVLSEQECQAPLVTSAFGRLGVVSGGRPVILPVNYVFEEPSIVVRTGPGAKLDETPLTIGTVPPLP